MSTLPATLALVDDDPDFADYLAEHLRAQGVEVAVFTDGADLIADPRGFGFDFYVVDLMLGGIDGIELIKVLRRRTDAGVLVVSGRLAPNVFELVVHAGADMYLAKPVTFAQVTLAVVAVNRRSQAGQGRTQVWRLLRERGELVAPDGVHVALSETDLRVIECLAEAGGGVVSHQALRTRLGLDADSGIEHLLHATMYRLRRRIERATPLLVPLQSQPRVGYRFRGELVAE